MTDNTLRGPGDYEAWTITAPSDPRLPNGGGYPINLHTVTAAAAARGAQNLITFDSDFIGADHQNYWHGFDITFNARLRQGLTLQFGSGTGREVEDLCEIDRIVDPAAGAPGAPTNNVTTKNLHGCRDVEPWLTTLRGLASYTIPKIDLLVSGTLRNQAGAERVATWNVPNSVITTILSGAFPPAAWQRATRRSRFSTTTAGSGGSPQPDRPATGEDRPVGQDARGHWPGYRQPVQQQLHDDVRQHLSVHAWATRRRAARGTTRRQSFHRGSCV